MRHSDRFEKCMTKFEQSKPYQSIMSAENVKDDEIVHTPDEDVPARLQDDGAMKTKFKANWKKILFANYFQITEMNGKEMTVECKSCKTIMKDSARTCHNTLHHLKVFYLFVW